VISKVPLFAATDELEAKNDKEQPHFDASWRGLDASRKIYGAPKSALQPGFLEVSPIERPGKTWNL